MLCDTRTAFAIENFMMTVSEIEYSFGYSNVYKHGHMFKLHDDPNRYDKNVKLLPSGSEGTLDITVIKTKKYKTEFHICGCLRDVWDTKASEDWFNSVVEANKADIIKAKFIANADNGKEPIYLNYSKSTKYRNNIIKWHIDSFLYNIFKKHK